MKVNGVAVRPRPEGILVIQRPTGDIVFKAKSVDNLDEFHKLCKEPTPPKIQTKEGVQEDFADEGYKSALASYVRNQDHYVVIKSLEPSNIEWTKVDPLKPNTWHLWSEEMKESGLIQAEVNEVYKLAWEANSVSEAKLKAARDAFLQTLQAA